MLSRNNTRGVTPPSVIVNPSPAGHPFMTLVCDLLIIFYVQKVIVSCGRSPVKSSKTVANVVATSESLVVTSE